MRLQLEWARVKIRVRMMKTTTYIAHAVIACLSLTSCGGSGGGSSTPPPVIDTVAPSLSFSPNTLTVDSGQTGTSTLSATDNTGIKTGPNATCTNGGAFTGTTFTAPAVTVDTTSVCTATASDAAGNSGSATLTVTIPAPNAPPQFTGNTQFSQEEEKIEVFTISVSDPEGDTLTTTILSTGDGDLIEFDAAANSLKFKVTPNFEDPKDTNTDNIYAFTLQSSDGENTVTQAYALTVTDIDEGLALTGKVTLGPAPSEPDTTSQTNLMSIGDWTGDGHSDFIIKRSEYNSDIDDKIDNIFLVPGKFIFDATDSNIAVKDLQTGIRIYFNGDVNHQTAYSMSATSIPDIFGDGLPDIYVYITGENINTARTVIFDSAELAPLLNNGTLDQVGIYSDGKGLRLGASGYQEYIVHFYENLSFIDDVTGDGLADILYCQATADRPGGGPREYIKRRSFILGSEVVSQARISETSFAITLIPDPDNPGPETGAPLLQNRVFIDTNDETLMSGCLEYAGDIDGDGLGDFLLDGNLRLERGLAVTWFPEVIRSTRTVDQVYIVWGHAIANLINTGGTLLLEDLAASGNGVHFSPQVGSMRANTVGDMNGDGRADFYIEDFSSHTSDGEPVYNTYHIFGMPQSLLARYPTGEINPATLQSSERFGSIRAYVDFSVFDKNQFRQWFSEGDPVDIDQDGQVEWLSVGTRHSPDQSTSRHFHFEPAEFDKLGSPYSGGAENNIKDFEYPKNICCGTPPEFFVMRGFAKDIDNDAVADLLGEKGGTSFIVSGAKVHDNITQHKVLDLTPVFPELFETDP